MTGTKKFTRFLQVMIILLLNLFLIGLISYTVKEHLDVQTLSRVGSTGTEVRQIQTRLKSWGYYKGSVDGSYGAQTRSAVVAFQKKNNLRADGVAGPATLYALGLPSGGGYNKYSQSDYQLIARIISAEARGEPYEGQVAVGAVILNRIESPSFPDTVPGVVYQPGAFSCVNNGQFSQPVADSCFRAAQDALNGWDPTNGSIYYYNPVTAQSAWIRQRPILLRIGNHVFCK